MRLLKYCNVINVVGSINIYSGMIGFPGAHQAIILYKGHKVTLCTAGNSSVYREAQGCRSVYREARVGWGFVNREYRHAGLCAGGTWVCCGRNEVHMYA